MNLVVILDDGHGKSTPGKRSPIFEVPTILGGREYAVGESFIENTFNCAVADILHEELMKRGVIVQQTAPSHKDYNLTTRARRANDHFRQAQRAGKECIMISVHANAHQPNPPALEWTRAHGIETFCLQRGTVAHDLASHVQNATVKATAAADRGVKCANFFLLRKTLMPAILFEGGFMTNRDEVGLLADPDYQEIIAKSIMVGVFEWALKAGIA